MVKHDYSPQTTWSTLPAWVRRSRTRNVASTMFRSDSSGFPRLNSPIVSPPVVAHIFAILRAQAPPWRRNAAVKLLSSDRCSWRWPRQICPKPSVLHLTTIPSATPCCRRRARAPAESPTPCFHDFSLLTSATRRLSVTAQRHRHRDWTICTLVTEEWIHT